MPRKKKSPREMTSEELAKRVFPAKAVRELKKIAQEADSKPSRSSSRSKDSS
jgi:pyruvate kinase